MKSDLTLLAEAVLKDPSDAVAWAALKDEALARPCAARSGRVFEPAFLKVPDGGEGHWLFDLNARHVRKI